MINQTRKKIKDICKNEAIGSRVTIYGWVRTSRITNKYGFIELNDGSCIESIQLFLDLKKIEIKKNNLPTGTCICVEGIIAKSIGKEQNIEVIVDKLEVIGEVDEKYPLQKKEHSLDFLRDYPHLRSRTNTFWAVFSIRNKLSYAIHEFFQSKGFFYIHTPFFTKNDCEGGGETFQITTLDIENIFKIGKLDYRDDFFKQKVYLTVSGQMEAETFALSHGEVYTFGPTFRADPSDTPRHAAEFWMVEPEMAFYDFEDLKDLIQTFIKYIVGKVQDECKSEISYLSYLQKINLVERIKTIVGNDFEDISYSEIIKILQENQNNFEIKPIWGVDLNSEHENFITSFFNRPVFITNYPECFKPFYMWLDNNNKTVSCLDLLIPEIGEIITGSKREHRYDILKERIISKNINLSVFDWYLQTRKWGTAPHCGFGLGFDRLVMYLTGMKNIKDVLPYPRAARKIY